MAKRKEMLSIFLISLVFSMALLSINSGMIDRKKTAYSLSAFAMSDFSEELPKLPPIPILREIPERLTANSSLQELLSKSLDNKTLELPSNFQIVNSSTIVAKSVEFAENASGSIVEPSSQEIVDSDVKTGAKLKLAVVLYKDVGELDSKWDYYAVRVQIEDIYAKNDFWNGPLFADIWLFLPDWAEEMPINHQPQAGFRLSAGQGSFSYEGISFGMNFPAYSIGFEASRDKYPGWLFVHWWYEGGWGIFAYWYYVFKDYTEAAIGFRVPEGRKPYCYAAGWAAWYKFWIFAYTLDSTEMVKWGYVDPPEIKQHPEPPVPPLPSTPPTTPGPSKPSASLCVDAFVFHWTFTDLTYSQLKYIAIGGMGKDAYGWHAGQYSYVTLFAAISNGGKPVENVAVHFYLVDSENKVYDLGDYYTDDYGIAGVTIMLDPSSAKAGMYWFIAIYQGISDICGFSYIYCLLITGYTVGPLNQVYLEKVYLVPENEVISLTAKPPEGYAFGYWWINFYYISYKNPIYIYMDFDCIAIACYVPNPSGGGRMGQGLYLLE